MGSRYERLSAQDASFLVFETPETPMHVGALARLRPTEGGRLDAGRLRAYVASRLHAIPSYRWRLDSMPLSGHPIWVDDERFDLEYHVRHIAVPSPGGEAELARLVGHLYGEPLDRTRPLWEMWVLEGLADGTVALLSKIHHALVDGASGVALMAALYSTEPRTGIRPPKPWRPRPAPGRAELLADELRHRLTSPVRALKSTVRLGSDPEETGERLLRTGKAVMQSLASGLRPAAATPLNGRVGRGRRVAFRSLSMEGIREIRKALGGTVNDVLLAVVTGALRHFFRHRREPLRELDFRVTVPVNARHGEAAGPVGNRVSALFVDLPLRVADPVRRLRAIQQATGRLKSSGTADGVDVLHRLADWTGSDALMLLITRMASAFRPYNMIVTNVPGPNFPIYLLDARQEAIHPLLPLFPGQGAAIAAMSYLGRLHLGVLGEWTLVPDLDVLAEGVDRAFEELEERARSAREA